MEIGKISSPAGMSNQRKKENLDVVTMVEKILTSREVWEVKLL